MIATIATSKKKHAVMANLSMMLATTIGPATNVICVSFQMKEYLLIM